MKQKVPARALQKGDILGSNEIVLDVLSGLYTPKGKVEVILQGKNGNRTGIWNASTMINVERIVDKGC